MEKSTSWRSKWQVTLGVMLVAQLVTAVGFSMIFPFLPLYVTDLGSATGMSDEVMAGLVFSAQGFTMAIASPLWGAAADRYGRKLMVMRALFGGTLILGLMGTVVNGEQLILLRATQGFITGTVAANNAMVASVVPRKHIGFAMGSLQVGLWAGVALGPLLGGALADAYGYANSFFITAVALFVSGLLVYFGVKEEFVPQKHEEGEARPSMIAQWKHVLTAEGVGLVYVLRFLAGTGRTLLVPIAPLFVVALLADDAPNQAFLSGAVIAVSSATSTFSGVYLGRLGDRIGHRRVLIGAAIAAVIFYVPQVFVGHVWQLLVLQALAGLALGGLVSAPSALLAQYTVPGEEGAAYGLDNSIISASRAVAPLISSFVALSFGLRATFATMALFMGVIAVVSYFFLPRPKPAHNLNTAFAGD